MDAAMANSADHDSPRSHLCFGIAFLKPRSAMHFPWDEMMKGQSLRTLAEFAMGGCFGTHGEIACSV